MTERRPATGDERDELSSVYAGYRGTYAERWSIANPGNRALLAERDRLARSLLRSAGLTGALTGTVLDLGAGSGESFPGLVVAPGTIIRADLLEERLRLGLDRDRYARVVCADGSQLPVRTASVDLVILSTVLSSVADQAVRRAILADAWRALRPGGGLLVYEFRVGNPRNPNTTPLRRAMLAGVLPVAPRVRSLTVAPPLARRLGRTTAWSYPLLARLPFVRTHNLLVWTKP